VKVIAFTIGPIYETLMSARKTRELWAGSYLFSYFMKKLIQRLHQHGVTFILPHVEGSAFEPGKKAGLFHDRFIARDRGGDFALVRQETLATLKELSEVIARAIKGALGAEEIERQLKDYLQTYFIAYETTTNEPITEINGRLDAMELIAHFKTIPAPKHFLGLLFEHINGSDFKKDAFGERKGSFESLYEIAPRELLEKLEKSRSDDYYSKLDDDTFDPYLFLKEHFGEKLKQYHKYFAIVRADGDSFGTYINFLGDNEPKLQEFSKKIFDYSLRLPDIVEDYGGVCVFAGGDDLLALMPIVSNKGTIVDALQEIDTAFAEIFNGISVTLSFGVSITYHKFPLYEALQMSYDALMQAKNQKNQKNALVIKATKHSGQSFDLKLYKSSNSYTLYAELLKNLLTDSSHYEIPHAIGHKFDLLAPLINADSFELTQLRNLFDNFFNELLHQSKYKKGLDAIEALMHDMLGDTLLDADAYEDFEKREFKNDRYGKPYASTRAYKLDQLFSAVSIIKLLRGDR